VYSASGHECTQQGTVNIKIINKINAGGLNMQYVLQEDIRVYGLRNDGMLEKITERGAE
jgi:hypothetical protein